MMSIVPGINPNFGGDIDLPTAVDLRGYLPDPGNQGGNSCIAWSIAYASYSCQISQERRRKPTFDSDKFNPDFLFERIANSSNGIKAIKAIRFVTSNGCASMATAKEDDSKESAEAKTFRAGKHVRAVDLHDIKTYIAEGYPVMMIIDLDDAFRDDKPGDGPYVWSGVPKQQYHAVTAVGYDDSKNALLLMNSWGKDWKDGGFCWASYDNVDSITQNHWCAEAHVVQVKESAPFNAWYMTVTRRFGRRKVERTDFELRADRKVYDEDDDVISPSSWKIDGLACSDDGYLFMLRRDQTIYKRNDDDTWTHLSAGVIKNKKVAMMAASNNFPLHVLTEDGQVYEYTGTAGHWKAVTLSDSRTADLRLTQNKEQMRATTVNGDVFVYNEENENWALAP